MLGIALTQLYFNYFGEKKMVLPYTMFDRNKITAEGSPIYSYYLEQYASLNSGL
jgi:hypothetical protein